MMTHREIAIKTLGNADDHAGEAQADDYPATVALTGIGYALLEIADAVRDLTAEAARNTGKHV